MKLSAAELPWLYFALWQWLSHLQKKIPKREWMFRCKWSKHINSGKDLISCTHRTVKKTREKISEANTPWHPETGTFQYLLKCYHTLKWTVLLNGIICFFCLSLHHWEIIGLEIKSEDLNVYMIVASLLQTTSQNSHFSRLLLFYHTPFWHDP